VTSAVIGDTATKALRAENPVLRAESAALMTRLVELGTSDWAEQQRQAAIQRSAEKTSSGQRSSWIFVKNSERASIACKTIDGWQNYG
jgi:hypothetical protein